MAIIRCQACGKPNPDFLEVCQYCEARLKPLTGDLPQPPSEPASAPEQAGIIHCQACGKPNPAFFDTCQYCDARLRPLTGDLANLAPAEDAPILADPDSGGIIRCQACGKPNPAFLEACQYCDARLKPLTAELSPERPSPEPAESWAPPAPEAQPAEEAPDWLRALRGGTPDVPEAEAPKFEAEPSAQADLPDWLGGVQTSAPDQPAAPAEEVPGWLSSLRGGAPAEAQTAEAEPTAEAELPDWLRGMQPSAPAQPAAPAEQVPDWLSSLRGGAPTPEPEEPSQPAEPTAEADLPDWLRTMRASAPEQPEAAPTASVEETPDWLSSLRGGAPTPEPEEPTSAAEPTPEADLPDWLRTMRASAPAQPEATPPAPAPSEEAPDWLSALRSTPVAEPEAPAAEPVAEADLPDWLRNRQVGAPAQAEAAEVPPAATPEAPIPDWLQSLGTTGGAQAEPTAEEAPSTEAVETPAEEMPDWLRTLRGVPSAEETAPPPAEETPDWLRTLRGAPPTRGTGQTDFLRALRGAAAEPEPAIPSPAQPETPAPEVEGLEQASLPGWLAAMRPVDIGPAPLSEDVDNYEERVGALAGMRGVLRAEPAVALPHKSTLQVHKLEVSDAHSAQANTLIGLLSEEARERPAGQRRVQFGPLVERWLIVAFMLAAILIPMFLAPGLFPLPTTIGPETLAAFNLIQSLPPDRPALVAFDYEPAQSGELDPAAEALVAHLMRQGMPVVGVSARAAGAAVGDDLLRRLGDTAQYVYGDNYLNLGYIPGGAVGVLQFAADPRSVFSRDFRGQTEVVWDAGAVSRVSKLSDFGLIVVVAATPDSARAWIEQTQFYAKAVPIIAVVSAGAEPLVRPYYEARDEDIQNEIEARQLDGLVAGIVGASQYEQQAGAPGAAGAHWDALGGGLLAAAALIAGGNLVFGLLGLARRQRKG